ncbi:hypothetical protein PHMEG_00017168 [Phytophthora megakarya]|uniref:Transcription activator GCR1-like domain-containing protein n=1 Tax=Phytophthora megakarya TaxID=4795 RepID=A0A225VXG4_9STRA|nr:hypothetical protein PHMEG_00017168 [Phytophthora megakarya]
MICKISSVQDLWTEWHEGVMNLPSIEYLETTFITKQRSSAQESKFFSRRLYVINYVRKLVNDGIPVELAINKSDTERDRRSIDGFSKWLRSKNFV